MKATIIILISLSLFPAACSTSKNSAMQSDMQIANATFHNYREAPKAGSELPEVGSDLVITVKNRPKDFKPAYVVFRGKKSVSAQINNLEGTEVKTVIQARIIRSSRVMMEKSASMDVSDRLVYTNADEDVGFIEIKEWEEVKD